MEDFIIFLDYLIDTLIIFDNLEVIEIFGIIETSIVVGIFIRIKILGIETFIVIEILKVIKTFSVVRNIEGFLFENLEYKKDFIWRFILTLSR